MFLASVLYSASLVVARPSQGLFPPAACEEVSMWGKKEPPKVSPSPSSPVNSTTYPQTSNSAAPQSSQATPAIHDLPSQVASRDTASVQKSAPVQKPAVVENTRPAIFTMSIISKGLVINGEISGAEDLQIDGQLRGSIRLPGAKVMITPEGSASGNIEAREVIASERVLVGQTGHWLGDSISPRLVVEDGAVIKGKIEVSKPAPAPKKTVVENGHKDASETAEVFAVSAAPAVQN
jgi:cytoskeletal protein CcmA (bactofilin family)